MFTTHIDTSDNIFVRVTTSAVKCLYNMTIFNCGEQLYKHSMSVRLSVRLSIRHTLLAPSRVWFFSNHGETW